MSVIKKQGRCLCGAVTFTVELKHPTFSACHCSMCRQWAGGPAMAVDTETAPVYASEEHIKVFSSSDWAERGFCDTCGTHLFYRLKQGGFYSVPLGLLQGPENWTFDLQVYIDEKPAWYDFSNKTKTMTGAEVEAAFKP
ncbi:GFA family protein [Pseudomonas sp. R5(2019)]|uniref:GFA family protein n=1 Tax=Pseudomonas sp. R5(2019) TaxID=2697566 RepID=UPI001411BC7B|nr:GFA family protein [Pseudomonas sp. R5(2019)]NBA93883.1 GFA family protein [Pseudomonas sp. R5(2019)]